jgi:hypothetical protein
MEEKKPNSFYEFLVSNAKSTGKQEVKEIKSFYLVLSWILIQLINSCVVWIAWNHAVSPVFNFPLVSFTSSILMFLFVKTLFRGFFSPQ